ncbi:MAG: hypothetical protein A3G49_03120 [Candidatus Sungbacteria bacterium RIFCSPLOWO2_12_FULL_41_11]|uniref:Probable transcriptional regulatory protein A3G49_03120 n=1 Tax=Candidatus Sungbacteria bacterium RIFCSPLOWO2_12_FULL_41_11 TaxID=1802286 RepID=A0A1G2LRD9_9BACT|nr:MAG: transcriptional regulator [Parcubacteria group bacterium GW2011_GWA2_42_14]OGZ98056.1 MAG: hypothetical protein A3D41_05160 [Candidatus Sungbacteria bacterium RIFCSPHIGHO2_02_FULL_41_12b]OHA14205.1 MAG: hypothetical protein A3G49_03120 [Candidatus Sungbacteria bacterium RIFCSPLOWO2_12_FULL_41_11]
MSGHSKWAQIKHKKALTDAKKGKAFSKISRMITVAVKEKQNRDPSTNSKLRTAIEKARSLGMPGENVERAMAKGLGEGKEGEGLKEVLYEAFGPEGTALIIAGITDNKNRTTAEIKHLLSEHGGRLSEKGSVEWMFNHVAAFDFNAKDFLKTEEAELFLIDAGAEDISKNDSLMTAYVSPQSSDIFRKKLEAKSIKPKEEYFDYMPKNKLSLLNEETKQKVIGLMDALDDNDDVQEVYTNIEIEHET